MSLILVGMLFLIVLFVLHLRVFYWCFFFFFFSFLFWASLLYCVLYCVLNGRLWFIFFLFFLMIFILKWSSTLWCSSHPSISFQCWGRMNNMGELFHRGDIVLIKKDSGQNNNKNKEKKYFFCKIDMKVLSVCHFYWIGPLGRFSVSAVLSGCCLCVPSQKTRFPGD